MNVHRIIWLGAAVVLLVLLLLVPIARHDWGDDFAMYIMQAASYAGDGSYHGAYLYNPQAPMYAPTSYPPGFPLSLTPVYAIFGLNLSVFQYTITVFLVITAVIIFCYAREKKVHVVLSMLAVVMVCFHNFSLELREQVLSDIPFTGMVFLFLYVHAKHKPWYIIGLIALLALLTRSVGIVLIVVWLAEICWMLLFERKSNPRLLTNCKGWLLLLGGAIAVSFLFPVFSGYSFSNGQQGVFEIMHENYFVYKQLFEDYFMHLFNTEEAVFKFISWPLMFLFLTGIYANFRRKERMGLFFFGIYLMALLAYPYKWGGYRMIFPLIPFMWLFILQGVEFFGLYLKKRAVFIHSVVAVTLVIFISLQPLPTASHALVADSVESIESKELFEAIEQYVPNNSIIASPKPRAIALFTKRPGIFMQRDSISIEEIQGFLHNYNVEYVIQMRNHPNININTIVNNHSVRTALWANKLFMIMRIED